MYTQHVVGLEVSKLNCPNCDTDSTGVVDSRPTNGGEAVRRRRECADCGTRFTTYERTEWEGVQVRKRHGEIEPFDREKLLGGVLRAVEKRPVSEDEARGIADEVGAEVRANGGEVVETSEIGEKISERLREMDEVAYLRFVSVYKEFSDPDEFAQELDRIKED
ncbi:transcriptional regulator NrdR [Haladaptatus sp. F3-133]|jgi:transcriptional repressor NrdR|uniref:Transcriptional repressor NrdR n=1 Tax=Halorutilus salinus TaxID=2487751 RepID=A0A9Q4C2H7_9EURY|nr:transcriptional regulator NrdR [Halorutilus salinus]